MKNKPVGNQKVKSQKPSVTKGKSNKRRMEEEDDGRSKVEEDVECDSYNCDCDGLRISA